MQRAPARRGALALAVIVALSAPALARALPSPFVPAEDERRSAEERALEQSLNGALAAQPGVARSRVLVHLPRAAEQALDHALPPAEVAVWMEERGGGFSDAAVASLLRDAGLSRCRWRVTRRAAAVVSHTESGTEPVSRSWALRVVLALSLAGNVVLATSTLLGWPRWRPRLPAQSKES